MKNKQRRCDNPRTNKCLVEDDEYFYKDNEMARSVIRPNVLSKHSKNK